MLVNRAKSRNNNESYKPVKVQKKRLLIKRQTSYTTSDKVKTSDDKCQQVKTTPFSFADTFRNLSLVVQLVISHQQSE